MGILRGSEAERPLPPPPRQDRSICCSSPRQRLCLVTHRTWKSCYHRVHDLSQVKERGSSQPRGRVGRVVSGRDQVQSSACLSPQSYADSAHLSWQHYVTTRTWGTANQGGSPEPRHLELLLGDQLPGQGAPGGHAFAYHAYSGLQLHQKKEWAIREP